MPAERHSTLIQGHVRACWLRAASPERTRLLLHFRSKQMDASAVYCIRVYKGIRASFETPKSIIRIVERYNLEACMFGRMTTCIGLVKNMKGPEYAVVDACLCFFSRLLATKEPEDYLKALATDRGLSCLCRAQDTLPSYQEINDAKMANLAATPT
ncbi:hypothetical protein NDU88_003321 [Pleurodeles waltl]|uniref:Uncharacterized protein n=1 Tax=Pleurodeles waltl TaxID=8319 RepID=A0AAV7MVA0_PLEWA|nr:hypothetical protein NDU88_003321 [Pleurodeles waltl]